MPVKNLNCCKLMFNLPSHHSANRGAMQHLIDQIIGSPVAHCLPDDFGGVHSLNFSNRVKKKSSSHIHSASPVRKNVVKSEVV